MGWLRLKDVGAYLARLAGEAAAEHRRACCVYWSDVDDSCIVAPSHTNADGIALTFQDEEVRTARDAADLETAIVTALGRSATTERPPAPFEGWRRRFDACRLLHVWEHGDGSLRVRASRRLASPRRAYEPLPEEVRVPRKFRSGELLAALRRAAEAAREAEATA